MTRIKRGVAAKKRRKNLLKRTKGFMNRRSTHFRQAREALLHADTYSYRDRKNRKRDMRSLWLIRLGAALRDNGTTWSQFLPKMKKAGVVLNRKSLSEMAVKYPEIFDKMVSEVK